MLKTWVQSLSWKDPLEEGMATHSIILAWRIPTDRGAWQTTVHRLAQSWTQLSDFLWASLLAQMVKNPPVMWETWVRSLGWKDPLEEGMATHSSILAWKIPMDRGAWRATVHGATKSRT